MKIKEPISKIFEHFKTRKKYNTLENDFNTLKKLYEEKIIESETKNREFKLKKQVWEETLIKQEKEIIELKKRKIKKNVCNR